MNYPKNVIGQNPAGSFSFFGSVDISLAYERKDGQPLTLEDIRGIQQCGAGLFKNTISSRTYSTRENAEAAHNELYSERN